MVTLRKVPLVSGQMYHIFNKGIDGRVTFCDDDDFQRFVQTLRYYIFVSPPMRLSRYLRLGTLFKQKLDTGVWGEKLVTIICYCVMPNHFHMVLKQEADNGISKYIGLVLNSYTRYFNTKNKRVGQLFLDQFKNVLIDNDNQLLHVVRYVFLNPYSSGLLKKIEEIEKYKYSSFQGILSGYDPTCKAENFSSHFGSKNSLRKFVLDNSDYQKSLKRIRSLVVE